MRRSELDTSMNRNAELATLARREAFQMQVPALPRAPTPLVQTAVALSEVESLPAVLPFMERVQKRLREDPTFTKVHSPQYWGKTANKPCAKCGSLEHKFNFCPRHVT